MPIPTASVTDVVLDPIVTAGTELIGAAGLPAVFALMVLESACMPVPSEAIMLFAGASAAGGELSLAGVVVAGVLGNLVGSLIAYAVGYFGRVDLLERNRLIHVSPASLARADRWFARYGDATVFFSRMLPLVRTFVSLPAGIARMPLGRFTLLTVLGCVPWVLGLALIGVAVGDNWESWRSHLHYLDYAVLVAAIGLGIYLLAKRRRGGPTAAAGPGTP